MNSSQLYHKRKRDAGGRHTRKEWELLKAAYKYTCPACGKMEPKIKLTKDHIVPVSKGGPDFIENIQPLCWSCNSKKHNSMPVRIHTPSIDYFVAQPEHKQPVIKQYKRPIGSGTWDVAPHIDNLIDRTCVQRFSYSMDRDLILFLDYSVLGSGSARLTRKWGISRTSLMRLIERGRKKLLRLFLRGVYGNEKDNLAPSTYDTW